MPELRVDPLTGRRVIIAKDRAGRPNDFVAADVSITASASNHRDCPFCPGNEWQTPGTLQQFTDPDGNWLVRVVPNRYPAVAMGADAQGLHEVLIESREHVSRVADLSQSQWHGVLRMHVARLEHAAQLGGFAYPLLFKNVGASGGASLAHLHTQLLALPEVPPQVQAELLALRAYYELHGRCGWCDRIAAERADGRRMVADRDDVVAFCPAASRQPYETWILPASHAADFRSVLALDHAAAFLHDIICRVERTIGTAGYNLLVHSCPFAGIDPRHCHWRIEILPRLSPLAGLELATGMHLNSLSPERAAQRLRAQRTAVAGIEP